MIARKLLTPEPQSTCPTFHFADHTLLTETITKSYRFPEHISQKPRLQPARRRHRLIRFFNGSRRVDPQFEFTPIVTHSFFSARLHRHSTKPIIQNGEFGLTLLKKMTGPVNKTGLQKIIPKKLT
jgi:hypothetical protein